MNLCRLITAGRHLQTVLHETSAVSYFTVTNQRYRTIRALSTTSFRANKTTNDGDLVYTGTIASTVRNVKLLSLTTSALGLSVQPYLFMQAGHLGGAGILAGGVLSFFIFVTPLLLHYVTKKYVTALYVKPNSDEFTAYTISLFLRKQKTVFAPDDVTVPTVPGPFSSIVVKGRALFIDPNYFTDINAYKVLMGYTKAIEWDFPENIKNEYHEKPVRDTKE